MASPYDFEVGPPPKRTAPVAAAPVIDFEPLDFEVGPPPRRATDSAPQSPAVGAQRTIPKTGNPVLDFALGHSRPGVGVQDVQASAEAWKPTFDILADPLKNEAPWYQRAGRAALNNLPAPLTWGDEIAAWVARQMGSDEIAAKVDMLDEGPRGSFESDAQQAVTNTMMSGPSRVFAPMFAQARGQEQTANPTLFGAAAPRWEDLLPEARTGEQVITDLGRPEQYSEWESLLTGGEAALWQFASDPTNLIDVIAAARGLKGMRAQRAAEELLQREAVATRAREMTDAADARATSYADLAAAERVRQAQELEAAREAAKPRLRSQEDIIRQRYGDGPAGTTPEAALEQRLRAEEQARRQAESEARSAEMLAERQRQLDAERRLRGEAPEPEPLRGPAGEEDVLLGAPEDLAPPAPQAPASPLVIPGRTGGGELVLPPSSGPRNLRSRTTVDAPAPAEVVPKQAGVPSRVRPGDSYTARDGDTDIRFEVAEVLPRHPNPDPNNPFHVREADLPHARVLVFDPRSRNGPVEILQPLQNVERAVLRQRRPAPTAAPEAPAAARPEPEPAPSAPQSLSDLQQQTARGIGAMQDAERARRQQPRWSKSSGPAAVLEAPAPPRPVELAPAPPPAPRQGGIEVVRQERGPVRSRQTVDAPAPPRPEPLTPARAQARDVVSGRAPSQPALPSVGEVPFSVRGANFLAREGPNGRIEVVAVQNRGRQVPVTAPGAEVLKAAEAALAERRANPVREGVAIPMDEGTPVSPPERPAPTPDPDDEIPVYLRPFVREGREAARAAEYTQAGGPGKPRVIYRALPEDDGGVRVQKKMADGRWVDVPNPTPSNLALAKAALKKKAAAPAAAPSKPAAPRPTVAPGAQVTINNPNMVTHGQKGEVLRRAATDAPDGTPMWHVQVGKKQVVVAEDSLRVRQAAPAATPEPTPTPEPEPAPAAAAEEPTPTPEPEAPAETPVPKRGGGGTRQQRQAAAPSTPTPRGNLDIAPSRQQPVPAPRRGQPAPATPAEPLPPPVGTVHGQQVTVGANTLARRIPLHGLVRLVRELTGEVPAISEALQRLSKKLGGEVRGRFLQSGQGRIQLNPDLFQDEALAGKVLAHEIGHLVDYLPDQTLKRGTVLGHLLNLRGAMVRNFGTLTNAALRKELQELSAWWRPWDPATAGPKYRAYRNSAPELYADALSVMLNDLSEMQRRAPNFTRAFFDLLDRKPEVKQSLVNVHDFLSGTMDDVVEGLSRDVQAGFLKAETLWQRMREEAAAREGSIWERLRQQFQALHGAISFHLSDVGGDIKRRAQRLENSGVNIPEHLDPRIFFDSLNWDASGYRLAQEWDRRVQAPIRQAGVDESTVGELMFAERILGDRSDLANPFGITKETAPAVLDRIRNNATPQQWQAMQEASRAARELYWQALEEAVDAGIISRQRLAELEVTKDSYATFAVVDFLGDRIPDNLKQATGLTSGQPKVGAAIKQQKGTFREIANPLTATFMKGLSQRTWNAHNRARRGVIQFMKQYFPDEVVEAKRVGEGQFERPPHRDLREYQVWEDGERKVYHVHKDLADIFDAQPHHKAMMIAKLVSAPDHAFFRPLWLTYNAGFQAVNVVRDLGRTARAWAAVGADSGLPGARLRALNEYRKVLGEAWEYARGRDSDLAEAMMDEGALMPPGETFSAQMLGDSQTDALIRQRLGIGEERTLFQRTVGGFLRVLADAGSALEAVPKMASYKRLADRTSLSPQVRAHVVRNYVGTPNILTRGASTQITNRFLMFSNVMMQGMKSNLNTLAPATMRGGSRMAVPGSSPGRAWARTVQQAILPKVLMTAGALGFFGKDIKEGYDYMSSYYKQQFLAVPIGWEEGGPHGKRVVALTIPQDEMDRLLTGMLYIAAKRDRPGFQAWLEDELGFIKGQMTPDLGPSLRLAGDALAVASGKNPEDDFRGQPAIPAQEFEAGGWPRWRGFLRWKSSELGMPGDLIKTYAFRDDANRPLVQTWAANVPGLNRFIRVTDYGKSEEQRLAKDMEDQAKAQRRVGYGESTRYVYGQYWSLRNIKNRTPAQERAYQEASDFYNGTYRPGDEDVHEAETRKNEARAKSKKAQMERDAARARQRINRYLGRKA